jgi:hypothetical protein
LRAEEAKAIEDVDDVATVLVAPDEYLNEAQGREAFDALVSYEDLLKYCDTRAGDFGETGARFAHKRDMLEQAIEKYRRGYRAKPDKVLTDFWASYYLLAQEVAAGLKMQKPGPKPANSTWAIFPMALEQKRGLPHCEMAHKWPNAMVDIHLFGLAKHADVVEPAVEPLLGSGMKLRKASKSLAVSIEVPRLDPRLPFDGQREAAEQGLLAALRLQKWYQDNWAELRVRISRVVKQTGR